MQKLIFPVLLSFCILRSAAQPADTLAVKSSSHYFNWGAQKTRIVITQYGDQTVPVMINLHANEITSIAAATTILKETGGILIHIENAGQRLVSFKRKGRNFTFDPNRIFTSAGVKATLKLYSKVTTVDAISMVTAFGKFILQKLPQHSLLIALHNNTEGALSINSYLSGGSLKKDAAEVFKKDTEDPDNFFLVTHKKIYNLARDNFNVVLQHNTRAVDDGSLSIYYGRRKKNYVNIEAQTGHQSKQEEMIRLIAENTD